MKNEKKIIELESTQLFYDSKISEKMKTVKNIMKYLHRHNMDRPLRLIL